MIKSKKNQSIFLIILSVLLVALIFLNLCIGAVNIPLKDIFSSLFDKSSPAYLIVVYNRLPRLIGCLFVGAGLAVGGLLLQSMLNNELASPGIIGINSGAGLAVVISSILTINTSTYLTTLYTFIGAFITSILIYLLARSSGASKGKLILAGIAISKLFSSISDALCYLEPSAVTNKTIFAIGGFNGGLTFNNILFPIIVIFIGLIAALIISKSLGVLTLGDEVAQSLGLNVKLTRFFVLLIVALLSSGSVAIAGLLSFLGLIAPHIARKLFDNENYPKLTVGTILLGANITLLCDLLARTIFAPYEIPVGIIMSILGVPFFIFLLFGKGGKKIHVKN